MKNEDSDLIQQTLDGDEQAFTTLVNKYQKQVHALAWQKIGDYHIAQEITQDVFMTAYQKIPTFTHYRQFAGWLYVVTNRKCIAWHRKKKLDTQSIDETNPIELEEIYYSEYTEQLREEDTKEKRRTLVKNLLSKLQESERTVISLFYLAEMSCEEISEYLGVSPNTVRSRLHRARNRLKKDEAMLKENLSSFHLPTQFTENMMKEITRIAPVTPSGHKPLVPLAISAVSAIIAIFLIGIGAQNLIRFQKPYNFEAKTKPTIEITEVQLIVDSSIEPTVRRTVELSNLMGQAGNTGHNPDRAIIDAEQKEDGNSNINGKWAETNGPVGGEIVNLYATDTGALYAGTQSGIYRLTDDSTSWEHIHSRNIFSYREQLNGMRSGPMVEYDDTLYLATEKELLTSTDKGVTWIRRSVLPKGLPIGILFTNKLCYLCLTTGIYISENNGLTWQGLPDFDDEYKDITPLSIAALGGTIFAGTDDGLYRFNGNAWEELFLDDLGEEFPHLPIISMEVSNNTIYVARNYNHDMRYRAPFEEVPKFPIDASWVEDRGMPSTMERKIMREWHRNEFPWTLFVSNDHGDTWQDITPTNDKLKKEELTIVNLFNPATKPKDVNQKNKKESPHRSITYSPLKIIATSNKLIVIDREKHYITTNCGETWESTDNIDDFRSSSTIVSLNENTHYIGGKLGISRTTDAGKSWHQLNDGLVNTDVWQLIAVDGILYANTLSGLVYSTDEGASWTQVEGDTGYITRIMETNGNIYVRDDINGTPRVFYLSKQNNSLIKKTEIPILDKVDPYVVNPQLIRDINRAVPHGYGSLSEAQLGGIAVVNDTCYVEYDYQLFRWKPGTSEWFNTGLLDKGVSSDRSYCYANNIFVDAVGFKFAVSGNMIYVGEKEGQLMLSVDEGLTWTDVTENLPYYVDHFKAIALVDNIVYVATDWGVVISPDGIDWITLTDEEGESLIIRMFDVDGKAVYGEADGRIYKVNSNNHQWLPVTPKIPYIITCLDVDGNMLYVGTRGRGVLRYELEK